jgi:hypothetical protein
MARGDIKIRQTGGQTNVPTVKWQTEANATAIYAGEPLKLKAAGSPYVIPCADADLTIGTDTAFIGIAATDGTHTASADGSVDVFMPLPGVVYEAKAKTASTVDTQSEIDALCGDRVVLDLTSSTYTLDASAGDGANNAFYIVGGDPAQATVHFTCRADATYLAV